MKGCDVDKSMFLYIYLQFGDTKWFFQWHGFFRVIEGKVFICVENLGAVQLK